MYTLEYYWHFWFGLIFARVRYMLPDVHWAPHMRTQTRSRATLNSSHRKNAVRRARECDAELPITERTRVEGASMHRNVVGELRRARNTQNTCAQIKTETGGADTQRRVTYMLHYVMYIREYISA